MFVEKTQRVHEFMSHVTPVFAATPEWQQLLPAFFTDMWLTKIPATERMLSAIVQFHPKRQYN